MPKIQYLYKTRWVIPSIYPQKLGVILQNMNFSRYYRNRGKYIYGFDPNIFICFSKLPFSLNNPARRVGRGFHCSRQNFSHRAVLESRFSPALRFSWLLRHLSVLRKTGTWLLQCRPSTPTLYHTIDTHPESGNKRARFTVTNLYCYRVTLIIDWQIPYYCKCLYQFATFVIHCIRHIPYFHFSG